MFFYRTGTVVILQDRRRKEVHLSQVCVEVSFLPSLMQILTYIVVFLRVLEYYSGILFLTTNQIAQFDVAVQSRVHIALHYEKLGEEQSQKIFLNFLQQYRDKNSIHDDEYTRIKRYVCRESFHNKGFDGRQIRNIVGCAMSHARGEGQDFMTLEHIETVIGYMEKFTNDLKGQRRDWRKKQAEARLE
jgi:hypothetical protein